MNGKGMMVPVAALLLIAVMVASPTVQAVAKGYWDTSDTLKGKGREPMLVAYGGRLYSFFQFRTELVDVGIDQPGRRSDIYYSVFNGTNWSKPVTLFPDTKDQNGHGVHQPRATEYKGKLYVTMEAVEPSIKDDDAQGDYDVILRVLDGANWTPPLDLPAQVISERNDVNVSDYECRSIVFGGLLYFVWSQIPVDGTQANGSGSEYRRIAYRTFDGASWGPILVAAQDNESYFGMSDLAIFQDRLWASFQTNTSESTDIDIKACSFDGRSWTAPQRVNPAVEGSPVKRQNLNARLGVFGDRLYCVWNSLDTIAKSSSNYDIMISSCDGTSWSYAQQVNRPNDEGQDKTPDVKANGGLLYVVWSSNDNRSTDEQADTDIVMRSYDGRNWSQTSLVSPYGDNGTIAGDHNRGDDDTPSLLSWEGRLYCTWITYDQEVTGHKGGNPSVMVKQVVPPLTDGGGGGIEPPIANASANEPGKAISWAPVAAAGVVFIAAVAVGIALGLRRRAKAPLKVAEDGEMAVPKERAGRG